TGSMMLLVGEPDQIRAFSSYPRPDSGMFYLDFKDLSPEVFEAVNPDLVVSPAIATTFDCLEMAQFLSQSNFTGRYRVSTDNLPRPEIICREVRQLFPLLDFDVVHQEETIPARLN
ncbi:MAG: hypothetical protein ABF285_14830, partial [Pacificibacter sp.]